MAETFTELFYKDPNCKTFEATVLTCEEVKGVFKVTLSDTAFYPEGGGQLADHGTIGAVKVIDTRREAGVVYHYCTAACPVGAQVQCAIDWPRRFANMQNHSGEHVFSGFVFQKHGFANVGFHMDEGSVTCDFDGVMTSEEVAEIERLTNEAIYAAIPVAATLPSPEELKAMDYRSKIELTGLVRIVDIPGVDRCACCGTHVKSTGEIGMVKVLNSSTHRGGTRVQFVCGLRAIVDYDRRVKEMQRVSTALSVKTFELAEAVNRLKTDITAKDEEIKALNNRYFALRNASLSQDAQLLIVKEEGLGIADLKRFALLLSESNKSKTIVLLSAVPEAKDAYNYVLYTLAFDLKAMGRDLNARLNGRGGGNNGFLQGTFKSSEEVIETTLRELFETSHDK